MTYWVIHGDLLDLMKKTDNTAVYITILLSSLFTIDMGVIAGILWHGKANFHELLKNLQ